VVEPIDLTRDHKPAEPSERRRIELCGGFVCGEGLLCGELAVARAIGDFHLPELKGCCSSGEIVWGSSSASSSNSRGVFPRQLLFQQYRQALSSAQPSSVTTPIKCSGYAYQCFWGQAWNSVQDLHSTVSPWLVMAVLMVSGLMHNPSTLLLLAS